MFEQASLETQGSSQNPWAFTVSIAGQTALVTAAVLISLIHTDALPRSGIFTILALPGVPPSPPPRQAAPQQTRAVNSSARVFTAPSRVPTQIAIDTPITLSTASIGEDVAVVGGLPFGTESGPGSFLTDTIRRLPPPRAPEPQPVVKPDAPAPTKPIRVSSTIQSAKIIRQVNPLYPPLARQARVSGTVRLVAIIGRDGSIQNLQVQSGHPLLTPAAVEAVKQWLYRPTLLNNEPVEVITQIDVNFTLSQ